MFTPGPSDTSDVLRFRCPPEPASVSSSRRRLRAYLGDRSVAQDTSERAELVAAELLTNALESSLPGGWIELGCEVRGRVVSVEVANLLTASSSSPMWGAVGMPLPDAERGRGLPLVAALVARLSFSVEDSQVCVRAELVDPS